MPSKSSFFIYTTSVAQFALAIVQGFLMVPLYLQCLGQEMYGVWLTLAPIAAWLTIIDPGFTDIVRSLVANAHGADDKPKIGEIIGSWLFIQILLVPARQSIHVM